MIINCLEQAYLWQFWSMMKFKSVISSAEETEFYKALEANPYDILLLDINLKGVSKQNGFEILKELSGKFPDMKIVILSSYMTCLCIKINI